MKWNGDIAASRAASRTDTGQSCGARIDPAVVLRDS